VEDTNENLRNSYAIELVSLPVDKDDSGGAIRAAVSVTYLIAKVYIDSSIQICGKQKTDACAKADVSNLDGYVTSIRESRRH
jgi:hypothetical protein